MNSQNSKCVLVRCFTLVDNLNSLELINSINTTLLNNTQENTYIRRIQVLGYIMCCSLLR